MASSLRLILNVNNKKILQNITQIRNVVTRETGSVLEAPPKKGDRFFSLYCYFFLHFSNICLLLPTGFRGVLGAAAAIFTGVTVGSVISKDMASFLEGTIENIFITLNNELLLILLIKK